MNNWKDILKAPKTITDTGITFTLPEEEFDKDKHKECCEEVRKFLISWMGDLKKPWMKVNTPEWIQNDSIDSKYHYDSLLNNITQFGCKDLEDLIYDLSRIEMWRTVTGTLVVRAVNEFIGEDLDDFELENIHYTREIFRTAYEVWVSCQFPEKGLNPLSYDKMTEIFEQDILTSGDWKDGGKDVV